MIIAENKKAKFDYEILETFEAGIVLTGQEVKSLRTRGTSMAGSYIVINKNNKGNPEVFWVGANIQPYQPLNIGSDYDIQRDRKLLLNKKEINYLIGKTNEKGLTLVPLLVYTKKHQIKISFGLAKGKKKADKRESIKNKDIDRKIKRELRTRG
ncbi:MAG: SsrA-binding protein SmpB [Candidatus Pacebacteria bacterium]|jgi:SsrA-binding protein|nr:SsrA-binding protein SmpB [Candidatus Paceibacterota bacterium]MDD5752547.1 SsrA-binding protein SmpB [Candidatus Paceibacterota bacterium]